MILVARASGARSLIKRGAGTLMMVWAFRYLAMVVVIGLLFRGLQSVEWVKPEPSGRAGKRSMTQKPTRPAADGALEEVIRAGPHGHFLVEGMVDGVPVDFLIDTGASDIVLNLDDARRLGFREPDLEFTRRFETANGVVRGAPVTLRELRVGQLQLFVVQASVNEGALEVSLLGMSFLNELGGYEVADGRLILRW
jgi:clan AA aspartic protease (TIGR02281 family)